MTTITMTAAPTTASNCLQGVRQGRHRGILLCFGDKGMRGKGRGLEVHTLAYPCTLTKGMGDARGMLM